MEQFFKENATQPTSWSVGGGYQIRFSIAKDVYERKENQIKILVKKFNLTTNRVGNFFVFEAVKNSVDSLA